MARDILSKGHTWGGQVWAVQEPRASQWTATSALLDRNENLWRRTASSVDPCLYVRTIGFSWLCDCRNARKRYSRNAERRRSRLRRSNVKREWKRTKRIKRKFPDLDVAVHTIKKSV
jgi:hypothetical protein